MSTSALDASQMLDRLRINLQAAGVPASDSDFENFIESGSLAHYETFDHAVSLLSGETLPDYLAAWTPSGSQGHGGDITFEPWRGDNRRGHDHRPSRALVAQSSTLPRGTNGRGATTDCAARPGTQCLPTGVG